MNVAQNLHNAEFIHTEYTVKSLTTDGYFNFCVLLSMLGFCEDYNTNVW